MFNHVKEQFANAQEEQVQQSRTITVKIPAGVDNETQIRLSGEGHSGRGSQRGDLFLVVSYKPHSRFKVEGENLVYEAPVPVPDPTGGKSPPRVEIMEDYGSSRPWAAAACCSTSWKRTVPTRSRSGPPCI